MKFYQLALGAQFEVGGKHWQKTAMSVAQYSNFNGTVFPGGTEVTPIGEPLLLSEAEAARWKPSEIHWAAFMQPAPGES